MIAALGEFEPSRGRVDLQGPRPGCHLRARGSPFLPAAQKRVLPSFEAAAWTRQEPKTGRESLEQSTISILIRPSLSPRDSLRTELMEETTDLVLDIDFPAVRLLSLVSTLVATIWMDLKAACTVFLDLSRGSTMTP